MSIFTADLAMAISRLALLIALGWFLAQRGWVGPASRQPLMRLVVWVFFPAMIFDRVCGNALIRSGGATLLYLGVGFGMIVGGILVGRLVAAALRLPEGAARRTFSYSAGINNFGYLGIPVTAALFDRDVVGVLMVHNVGVEAAVWTFGVAFLTGGSGLKGLKNLVQPIPVALAIALLVNFAGWGEAPPARFAAQLCHAVGECAIPVGTILTGIFLHELPVLRGAADQRGHPPRTRRAGADAAPAGRLRGRYRSGAPQGHDGAGGDAGGHLQLPHSRDVQWRCPGRPALLGLDDGPLPLGHAAVAAPRVPLAWLGGLSDFPLQGSSGS